MCVFDYDENSRLLSKVDYIYEPSISDWIGLAKVEKVYDSLGRLSDNLSWTWLHDNWAGNLKTTFLYDESTNRITSYNVCYTKLLRTLQHHQMN